MRNEIQQMYDDAVCSFSRFAGHDPRQVAANGYKNSDLAMFEDPPIMCVLVSGKFAGSSTQAAQTKVHLRRRLVTTS